MLVVCKEPTSRHKDIAETVWHYIVMGHFVALVVMVGYVSCYSVVTDRNTVVKIPLPEKDQWHWSRVLLAAKGNDTQADVILHARSYEILKMSSASVPPRVWHICDFFQPTDNREGYITANVFHTNKRISDRIIHVSFISNASVTWVLCTNPYMCDMVSLKQGGREEEQAVTTEAVMTSYCDTVLIAVCVLLALLSFVLTVYICWMRQRGGNRNYQLKQGKISTLSCRRERVRVKSSGSSDTVDLASTCRL
ncbi:uncharacterized protein LOC122262946 [Penaeus japonicus]|uniref:uncharacterized protein LOC122257197 n=1 Tax=Penaeus japonicus TaxID=27405 RepID=UPI001C711697|nr:uncharacterized protein LOC122257197 [Penaeus japonicus]XP_042887118.1 uncharacterized protein LOC122262946 [Penaeus japonicus]